MYTPTVTTADWTNLDRDIWTRIFAAIPAFRQKVYCQQVCKAWLFDLRVGQLMVFGAASSH